VEVVGSQSREAAKASGSPTERLQFLCAPQFYGAGLCEKKKRKKNLPRPTYRRQADGEGVTPSLPYLALCIFCILLFYFHLRFVTYLPAESDGKVPQIKKDFLLWGFVSVFLILFLILDKY
jgi:hypothetical protein